MISEIERSFHSSLFYFAHFLLLRNVVNKIYTRLTFLFICIHFDSDVFFLLKKLQYQESLNYKSLKKEGFPVN